MTWLPFGALANIKRDWVEPEVTILSTMVANYVGSGEWGFSALIEAEDEAILFDTGLKPTTVLENAEMLGKDLSRVRKVVLSHFHTDHTGGLLTLRRELMKRDSKALEVVYVAKGFFEQRYGPKGQEAYSLPHPRISERFKTADAFRLAAEAVGIRFVEVEEAHELAPGIFATGPVARIHHEPNTTPGFFVKVGGKLVPDRVADSQSVGLLTQKGWVLISGCGHAGIINAAEALRNIQQAPLYSGVGGFHLFRASDQQLAWTAEKLREMGFRQIVGAHCTGTHATYEIARSLGLSRSSTSIGAIGTTLKPDFSIERGSID